jgi:DNA-binding MarR family transcriptional regulator
MKGGQKMKQYKERFSYKEIPALIAYLGETTAEELAIFINEDKEQMTNELERLVRKERIEVKEICGEKVYKFIGD